MSRQLHFRDSVRHVAMEHVESKVTFQVLPAEYRLTESLFPFSVAELRGDCLDPDKKENLYFCIDCMQWVEGEPEEHVIREPNYSGRSFRCVSCHAYMGLMITFEPRNRGGDPEF